MEASDIVFSNFKKKFCLLDISFLRRMLSDVHFLLNEAGGGSRREEISSCNQIFGWALKEILSFYRCSWMGQWESRKRKSHNRRFSFQLSCDMSFQTSLRLSHILPLSLSIPENCPFLLLFPSTTNLNLNTKDFPSTMRCDCLWMSKIVRGDPC